MPFDPLKAHHVVGLNITDHKGQGCYGKKAQSSEGLGLLLNKRARQATKPKKTMPRWRKPNL